MSTTEELQHLVDRMVSETDVPGAVLGVLADGEAHVAAAGVANRRTGAPMTAGTLFLAGSITKTWVATALMTLVEDGSVSLDVPVEEYLPGLRLARSAAGRRITVRQLLTHASGLDAADLIVDVGRGDGAVERYVSLLADVGFLHEPGVFSSYCNPGFVLAGRLLEVLLGCSYRDAMRDRLLLPLGLTDSVLTPEEAALHSTAVGHLPSASGTAEPTARLLMPEGLAPAGATLFTTARDLLAFAQLHLGEGGQVLGAASIREMASHQMDLPAVETGSMGLSWFREERGDEIVLSHGGGSLGGQSLLVVLPARRAAISVFVNTSAVPGAVGVLRDRALQLLGVPTTPSTVRQADSETAPDSVCGTYRSLGLDVELSVGEHGLTMASRSDLPGIREYLAGQPHEIPCQLLEGHALGVGRGPGAPVAWFLDEGDYLYSGLRLARRAA